MKFEKILIIIYLLAQFVLALCIKQISSITTVYLISTYLTIIFYIASFLKDPGYLLVDEINLQIQQREIAEAEDQKYLSTRKEINKLLAGIVPIAEEIARNDNIMYNNEDLQHLGFSKRKKQIKRDSRFCGICMINQPYRTRHCHQCQKCVATYDHHCPWINNCVGEKNRHLFYLFLAFQTVQVFTAAILICSEAVNRIIPILSQWILGLSLILFLSVVFGLTIFHTYLMCSNMTTWQLARWDSIPYLCKFDKSKGSPFSKGTIRNIGQYWSCGLSKLRKIWEFQN